MTQTRWRRVALLVAGVALSLGPVVLGQSPERPKFSGIWELLTPELQAAEKQLARSQSLFARGLSTQQTVDAAAAAVQTQRGGEGFVIDQTAATMSVTKIQAKEVVANYNLDGSESRYVANNVPTSAKASWVTPDKLVATETATPQAGTTTQGKRSWSISADGLLTMTWTTLSAEGREIETITALYRRARTP